MNTYCTLGGDFCTAECQCCFQINALSLLFFKGTFTRAQEGCTTAYNNEKDWKCYANRRPVLTSYCNHPLWHHISL